MPGIISSYVRRAVVLIGAAAVVQSAIPPDAAMAHKGAAGVVMHRMNMMKDLQKAMRDMAAMLQGERRYDAARFVTHAVTIRAHARRLPAMFPKGSNPRPSEALPTVWRDWNDFLVVMKAMGSSADNLVIAGYCRAAGQPEWRAPRLCGRGAHLLRVPQAFPPAQMSASRHARR